MGVSPTMTFIFRNSRFSTYREIMISVETSHDSVKTIPYGVVFIIQKFQWRAFGFNWQFKVFKDFISIPTLIGNLKSLQSLVLSHCELSRPVLTSIGNLKFLQTLFLSYCKFLRSIPASLENLTQITHLDLSKNYFRGKIPNVFNNLKELNALHLFRNKLSGKFLI